MELLFHDCYVRHAAPVSGQGRSVAATLRDRRAACSSTRCRATRSSPRRPWRRSTGAGGGSSPSSGSSSCTDGGARALPRGGPDGRGRQVVKLDPEFVLEQVAKAPREFDAAGAQPGAHGAHRRRPHGLRLRLRAARSCARATSAARRRCDDFENLVRLSQAFPQLDSPGGTICEPNDRPLDSRHLDMVYALHDAVGQAVHGLGDLGPERASTRSRWPRSCSAAARRSRQTPAMISLINVNSPLRYDDRMLGALLEYATREPAGASCTPFLLMGAMSPVSIPATLVQQMAEALAGIALDAARSGRAARSSSARSCRTPTCSRARRASARPSRRSACSARARSRAASGCRGARAAALTASQTVDAQAAYEALMTMLPTFLAGANFVMHSAGWLESRARLLLREVHRRHRDPAHAARTSSRRSRSTRRALAFGAHDEVGARRALPRRRCTRSSASASASTGRCSPRPRTSSAGTRNGGLRRGRARGRRSGARRSRTTSSRRWTTACARSSRST